MSGAAPAVAPAVPSGAGDGDTPTRRGRWARGPLLVAAACVAAAAVLYALALGVDAVRGVDEDLRYPQIVGDWRLRDDASDEFARIAVLGFAGWGAVVAVVAVAAGRMRRLAAAGATVALGAAVTWALSEVLGRLDPLGGEVLRYSVDGDGVRSVAPGGFPSGHAAMAMALAAATVVATPPRLRAVAVAVTALPVAAVCTAMMALGWHYPSDILGGVLLSTAAAAVVVAYTPLGTGRGARPVPLAAGAAVGLIGCAVAGALALGRLPDESAREFVDLHPRFIAFCAAAAILTAACAVALSAARGRPADPSVGIPPRDT